MPPTGRSARASAAASQGDGTRQGKGGGGGGGGGTRDTDEPETRRGRRPFSHRGIFARDVRALLYAYGDAPNSDPATVDLLEDLTVDFLTDLCHRARPSVYALPHGPGMRALVPVSETGGSGSGGLGVDIHPTALSAIAAGSTTLHPGALGTVSISKPVGASSSTSAAAAAAAAEAQQRQVYVPLPASAAGHPHFTRARIKVDDLKHALRKDGKKFARVEELLYLDKVISEARRQMDVGEAAAAAVAVAGSGGQGEGGAGGGGGSGRSGGAG